MSNQSMYAMYVIGRVESDHNWAAVNTGDPITLGMMQWYGTRAAQLIRTCAGTDPDGYKVFKTSAPTLASQVEANNIDFNSRYVTTIEANAWRAWAGNAKNHQGQQNTWDSDYQNYSKVCDNVGMPGANIQARIMFMCAYHQSPRQALAVIGSVGGTADLYRVYTGILADGILGRYRNRYDTAYNLLKNWDGQSAPPDFGQIGGGSGTPGGNNPPSVTPIKPKRISVRSQGDTLIVSFDGKSYVAYPSAAQTWIAQSTGGQEISGGNTGGGSSSGNASDDAKKVLQWIADRAGKFAYGQGAGRLNPDQTGYTDCSGLIWSAFHFGIGKDLVGTWTGDEAGKGSLVCSSSNTSVADGIKQAKAADVLLITWSGHNPSFDHEEIFTEDTNTVWSHGGPGRGPEKKSASQQMGWASEWQIRRHL